MSRRSTRVLLGTLLASLVLAATASAAPGDPDQSFSGDGFAFIDLKKEAEEGSAVAMAPDGKIVIAADWFDGPGRATILARLLPDGSLDQSFGSGGIRTYSTDCEGSGPISDLRVLPDGKILTAGGCKGDFLLMRFNSNGTNDLSFDGDLGNPGGGNGVVRTDFAGVEASAISIAVDGGDGAITLSGLCCTGEAPSYQDTAIARYHADGRLDQAFDGSAKNLAGGNGKIIYELGPTGDDRVEDSAPIGGGDLALAGFADDDLFLGRIDEQGDPVTGFAGDGFAEIDHGPFDSGGALAMDGGGGFVVANTGTAVPGDPVFAASRLDSTGSLDKAFGAPTFNPTPERNDSPSAVLLQADDGLLLVGSGFVKFGFEIAGRIAIGRLRPDGAPDPGFGSAGLVVHAGPQGGASAIDATLDSAGRVVVVGSGLTLPSADPAQDVAIARFKMKDDPPLSPAEPSPSFRFGKLKRNKKRGTAILFVRVSGPGEVVLAKTRKLRGAKRRAAKAGTVRLPIRPRGKAKRRLAARAAGKRIGKLKVKARVTFQPDDGAALTRTKRLKLIKR